MYYVFWRISAESTSTAGRVMTLTPMADVIGPFKTKNRAIAEAEILAKMANVDKVLIIEGEILIIPQFPETSP